MLCPWSVIIDVVAMTTNSTKSPSIHHPPSKLAYNTAEAAKSLGVSIRSLKRLEQRGLLRSSVALRRKLYSHQEFNRFLEETSR